MRFDRDRRGYETTALVQAAGRGRGKRLLYWFRTPPGVRVGRAPIDETAIRLLEQHNPDVEFDWTRILKAPPAGEGQGRRDPRDARDRDQRGRREPRPSQRPRSGGGPPPAPPPRQRGAEDRPPATETQRVEIQPRAAEHTEHVTPQTQAAEHAERAEYETLETEAAEHAERAEYETLETEAAEHAEGAEYETLETEAAEHTERAEYETLETEAAEHTERAEYETLETQAAEHAEPSEDERLETETAEHAERAEYETLETQATERARHAEHADYAERVEPEADAAESRELDGGPQDVGSASYVRLGAEGLVRLRARYAEVLARIAEQPLEEAAREELKLRAERLNPDAWVTADEVTAALEQYETVFEGLRGVIGRHPRRRPRGRR